MATALFSILDLTSDTFVDGRRLPVPSGLGSASAGSDQFFGRFGQFFMTENLAFSVDLFHGDTSFRPIDWQVKFTPEINFNYLDVQENGIVNFDVRKGHHASRSHVGLQEGFVEVKLKDLSNQLRLHLGAGRHSILHQRFSRISFSPIRSPACACSAIWIRTAINSTQPISRCSKRTPTAD